MRKFGIFILLFCVIGIFVPSSFASSFKKKIFFAKSSAAFHWKTKDERRALRKARNETLHGNYIEARKNYEKLVLIDSSNFEYNFELGMNYYFAYDNRVNAIKYLETAFRHTKKDTIGELFYYLADCYHFAGYYDKAISFFTRMKPYITNGEGSGELRNDIDDRIKQCERAKEFAQHINSKIKIENLGTTINSENSEYVPVVNDNDSVLLFTSRNINNTGGKLDLYDEKYFEDMYISRKVNNEFAKPEKFLLTDKYVGLIPNSKKHDAVVSLSLDEKELITFKENKLWISQLKNNEWSTPTELPSVINKGDYEPHASLCDGGKTIYFTSDKEGGMGGLYIYKSTLSPAGIWTEPVNLGPEINSAKDEDSPNITANGKVLYFSSKGHNTMGGYDIFRSNYDSVSGKWSEAENLGMPINSSGDDIFYRTNKKGTLAYFSSYRPEGFGDMDIYRSGFVKTPHFENCISMKDLDHVRPLIYFDIYSKDTITVKRGEFFQADNFSLGNYTFAGSYWQIENDVITDSSKIHHTFNSTGNYTVKLDVFAIDKTKLDQIEVCVSKEIKVVPVVETVVSINGTLNKDSLKNLNQNNLPNIGLEKIYYDFDKYGLRKDAKETIDKNIAILLQHPDIVIKISANTDSRGSKQYNKKLSERRARYAVWYMEKHGIAKNRIIAVLSNGEEDLINKCADGEECSNADHALNRRTEFTVVATKK